MSRVLSVKAVHAQPCAIFEALEPIVSLLKMYYNKNWKAYLFDGGISPLEFFLVLYTINYKYFNPSFSNLIVWGF